MATSCDCPPDRRLGSLGARGEIRSSPSDRSTRFAISPTGRPMFRGPKAISSQTVADVPESWAGGFWNRIPQRRAASCGGRSDVAASTSHTWPSSFPPVIAGASPAATRQRVLLPASFGPTRPTTSPGATDRSTASSAQARAPAYW